MLEDHFSDYQYRAPSARQVAMRANEMEKKWRLESGLEQAGPESERYGEARMPWFFTAFQWLKEKILFDEKIMRSEKITPGAATAQRPTTIDFSCVDC